MFNLLRSIPTLCFAVGGCFLSGCMCFIESLAEEGDMDAQYELGVRYIEGDGVEQSAEKAVEWFRKSAGQGYAAAQNHLGVCYENGDGVEQSAEKAVMWYRKAAEQGYALAQNNLGVCYYDGDGVEQSAQKAVQWFRKAVEQGCAAAQNNLGMCYDNGDGVGKSAAKAVVWYRKSAEQGYVIAQYNLGVCYANGEGVVKSAEEAVVWYRKAAEQGHALAQNNLGVCYYDGEGVGKSAEKAVVWFQKSAEQGNVFAQNNLGRCYDNGDGVERSAEKAVLWYRKAAEQDYALAQYNLGVCYYNGEGVAKSIENATVWIKKAAENGDENAKQFLKNTYAREMGERVFAFRQELDGVYGQFQKSWQLFCSKKDLTEETLVFSDMVSDLNSALYRISADGLPDDVGVLFENLKNMGRRLSSCEEDYALLVAKDKKLKEDNASGAAKMLTYQVLGLAAELLGGNGSQLMNTSTQVGVGNLVNAGSQYGEIEVGKKILYNKIDHTKNKLMKHWSELNEAMDRYR